MRTGLLRPLLTCDTADSEAIIINTPTSSSLPPFETDSGKYVRESSGGLSRGGNQISVSGVNTIIESSVLLDYLLLHK